MHANSYVIFRSVAIILNFGSKSLNTFIFFSSFETVLLTSVFQLSSFFGLNQNTLVVRILALRNDLVILLKFDATTVLTGLMPKSKVKNRVLFTLVRGGLFCFGMGSLVVSQSHR